MSKLIFEIKGDERKWDVILNDFMGEELKKECIVENDANAKNHWARVHFLNYKPNKELVNKLSANENIMSAYIIDNKKITKTIR